MPSSLEGMTGERNVAELCKNKLYGVFDSVQNSRDLDIIDLSRNPLLSAVEWSKAEEVSIGTSGLPDNKSPGMDTGQRA